MKGKRIVSLLLCLVMVLGLMPGLAIPASAEDVTYTKYNLNIAACTSEDGSAWTANIDDAIDFSKSTISCWYLKRGKTPTQRNSESMGTATAVNYLGTSLIFEAGADNYNAVTFKIYLKEGYKFDETVRKALPYNDANHTVAIKRFSCSVEGVTGEDDSGIYRTYKYTANSSRWDAGSTLYLGIPVVKTGESKKTVTLRPNMASTEKATVTVTEGETLPDLTTVLQEYDAEYFSVADVENWYTQEPKKQSDGTYKYDEAKVFDLTTPITDNLTLYAKPKVKDGEITLPTKANLPMYEGLSDSNLIRWGGLVNWVYTPEKKPRP